MEELLCYWKYWGYFLLNHKSYSITDYFAYSQAKVHVEVGKEQDDRPGVISIGVIGTASRNYCALQKIDELYEKFLNVLENKAFV